MTELSIPLETLPKWAASEILDVLQRILGPGPAVGGAVVFTNTKGAAVGEITVKDTEANLSARVTPLDAEGHETTFDATPTWESSDEDVVRPVASDDGYSATFEVGAPGSAVVTVRGVENSSGEDVEIVSTGLVNVTAGDAVVGSIDFTVGG